MNINETSNEHHHSNAFSSTQNPSHEHTHDHPHTNDHDHGHKHDPEHTKAIINRLARAKGHLDSVKNMIHDERDCSEVLIQLSAVISALTNTGKLILQDHIEHCIVAAVDSGDKKAIEDLNKAINMFIK